MEKAAVTGRRAGSCWEPALGPCTAAALAACLACPAVQAQQAAAPPTGVVVAQARTAEPPLHLEVQTSTLPRLDAQDTGFQAPRVDVSLVPRNALGLGPVLGVSGFSPQQQLPGLQPQRTSVDLGLRWSHRLEGQRQIDITAWRRMTAPDDAYSLIQMQEPVYGARVEMNLSAKAPPKPGFAFDRGFIGFQLESGARITFKRKDGRPMIYYRTTF
jgi:hypothetical protein